MFESFPPVLFHTGSLQDVKRASFEKPQLAPRAYTLHFPVKPVEVDPPVPKPDGMMRHKNDESADFYSWDMFQLVLRSPTTAHRFLRFCQARACGENIEFLQKVDKYHRLLEEASAILASIQDIHVSPAAPSQINISYPISKRLTSDLDASILSTIPALDSIFVDARRHVEELLSTDIYPRFVKHQLSASAALALSEDKSRHHGLGDSFCLTDPSKSDNPIVFASDGFIDITGYSRRDIVPRNCRFLQGEQSDLAAIRRIRTSISEKQESVELVLNYRKNGEPFWNLLYISPLLDEHGRVAFYLGGQIDCSSSVHSSSEILRILSLDSEEIAERLEAKPLYGKRGSVSSGGSSDREAEKRRSGGLFRNWATNPVLKAPSTPKVSIRDEAGMEGELLDKLEKLHLDVQAETFYTAYSKYIVLQYHSFTHALTISHYSHKVLELLGFVAQPGAGVDIFHKDIFKLLESSSASASSLKIYKNTVLESMRKGKAVSIELVLQTAKKGEERYTCHYTPTKDEDGKVRFVVLTIAPR